MKSLGCIALFLAAASLSFAGPGLAYWQQRTQATKTGEAGKAPMADCHTMAKASHDCCHSCSSCAKKS